MDKYFIRYNPTFFVSPVQLVKYLSFETRFKAEYLCGQKTISNPELYFQYYLDKMEAIRLEKFLGNIDLARYTFEQIQDQKLQSLVYYNYLKGFVFKYENYEGLIERKYIPANSLSQLGAR